MTPEILKAIFILAAAIIFTMIMHYHVLIKIPLQFIGKIASLGTSLNRGWMGSKK